MKKYGGKTYFYDRLCVFLFIIFLLLQILMTKLSNDPRSVLNKVTWGYKVLDPETVPGTVAALIEMF